MGVSAQEPSIFVSHSHKDNSFCLKLIDDLSDALGNDEAIWYDKGGLRGGDLWWRAITGQIKKRNTFLLILSPHAKKSHWVQREIAHALKRDIEKKMRFITVLYQPCRVPDDLQLIQSISFLPSRPYEEALQELMAALNIFRGSDIPKPSQSVPAQPVVHTRLASGIEKLLMEIRAAYRDEDWPYVIEKIDLVARRYPEHLLPSLCTMQGWAYYYNHQSDLARTALERGIKLVKNPQAQLSLRDVYTAQLMADGQWNQVVTSADEASLLDPDNTVWQIARSEAIQRFGSEGPQRASSALNGQNSTYARIGIDLNTSDFAEERTTNPGPGESRADFSQSSAHSQQDMFAGKLMNLEVRRASLKLKREQIRLENEQMAFIFEMAHKYIEDLDHMDTRTRSLFIQTLLARLFPFEDDEELRSEFLNRFDGQDHSD